MQRALIIYAHPNPQSFCHGLKENVLAGLRDAEVRIHDLYAENFNPVLSAADIVSIRAGNIPADILKQQEDILWATHLIFIYPIWWVDRPAILKGWFDRVFQYGFAHKGGKGLLAHEKALVLQTAGEPEATYANRATPLFHETIGEGTLVYCGIKEVTVKTFFEIPKSTNEQRSIMLKEAQELVKKFLAN